MITKPGTPMRRDHPFKLERPNGVVSNHRTFAAAASRWQPGDVVLMHSSCLRGFGCDHKSHRWHIWTSAGLV